MKHQAIYATHSNVVTIRGDDAFDANGNPVTYDETGAIIPVEGKPSTTMMSGLNFRRASSERLGRKALGMRVKVTPQGRLSAAVASMTVKEPPNGPRKIAL